MEKIFTQAIDTIFKKPILLVPMVIPAVFAMAFAGKILIDFWRSGFDIYYFANFDISHLIYAVIILLLMEGIMIYDFTLKGNIEIKKIIFKSIKVFPIFLATFLLFLIFYIIVILPFSFLATLGTYGIILMFVGIFFVVLFVSPIMFYILPSTADGKHFHNALIKGVNFLRRDLKRGFYLGLFFLLISLGISLIPIVGTFLQYIFLLPFFIVVITIYYLKEEKGIEYSIEIEVKY